MKNKTLKIVSLLVCVLLACTGLTATVFALSAKDSTGTVDTGNSVSQNNETEEKSAEKNETVYVIAGADGSVKKLIVSDWLKNAVNSGKLNDKSELSGIENVKGDETYTSGKGNSIVWDAQGNDIYYQGNIEKELPVSLGISYMLDGKAIGVNELAGKSGRVTIRFDYTNNQYKTVEIDGKKEKIYVPFAMLTGVLLDNDIFTNVEVSNGKTVNDGNHTAVVGIAFPGLNDNLKLNTEKFEIPSFVEISADVKNFKITSTVTVATNEIFNKFDASEFDRADELTGKISELTDGVNKLMNGSSELYDGVCTLLEKSGELVNGVNKLAEGVAKLKDGSEALVNGSYGLADGVGKLSSGLDELSSKNALLNGGADSVFSSLLSVADSQLASAGVTGIPLLTKDNYKTVLNGVLVSLSEENVKAQVKQKVTEQVTVAVKNNIKTQVVTTMGMTLEEYESGVAAGTITEAQQDAVNSAVNAKMQESGTQIAISDTVNAKMNSDEVKAQTEIAVANANAGREKIQALLDQLDSYNTFYLGLAEYTKGVLDAAKGADELKVGADKLYAGSVQLDSGIEELLGGIITLKNGAPALVSGIEQLRDGSMQLRDGLAQLNEEGIKKITDAVDGDVAGLVTRIRATIDVSKDYTSFSGISDDMNGSVKFIYRTDSVK